MWKARTCIRTFQITRSIGKFQNAVGYHANSGCRGFRPTPVPSIEECEEKLQNRINNANLVQLVAAYREHGYHQACIDPLSLRVRCDLDLLKPDNYGFKREDYNEKFKLAGIVNVPNRDEASLGEVLTHLESTYCGPLLVEMQHIVDKSERVWFADLVEGSMEWSLTDQRQKRLVNLLLKS